MFPTLLEYFTTNGEHNSEYIVSIIKDHIKSMRFYFDQYFPISDIESYDWIRNPFLSDCKDFTIPESEEWAELYSSRNLELRFRSETIISLWSSMYEDFPLLYERAIKVLLQFPSTYLCESGFSALVNIKTKWRSRLDVENDMRVCLSSIVPRIYKFVSVKFFPMRISKYRILGS